MKKLFIIANWKSHKTQDEASAWLQELRIKPSLTSLNAGGNQQLGNKNIIVCPSFTSLLIMSQEREKKALPIQLGAQNISQFDEGAYTGEVSAKQIKEFVEYVIIGHSERRKYFGETDEVVSEKVKKAITSGITPIVCVSNLEQVQSLKFKVQSSEMIIAYEPLSAIGSGNPDNPEHVNKIAEEIKEIHTEISVVYGGSVTSKNVESFTDMENIDGVLVGSASLDPVEFSAILQHA